MTIGFINLGGRAVVAAILVMPVWLLPERANAADDPPAPSGPTGTTGATGSTGTTGATGSQGASNIDSEGCQTYRAFPSFKKCPKHTVFKILGDAAAKVETEADVSARGGFGLGVDSDWLRLRAFTHTASATSTTSNSIADFGRALLDPDRKAASVAIDFRYWGTPIADKPIVELGPHVSIVGAFPTWEWTGDNPGKKQVLLLSGDLAASLATHDTFADNYILGAIDLGLSFRCVGGSLANADDLRNQMLGTYRACFVGPSVGFTIQINKLIVNTQLPFLSGKVDGLSSGAIIVTVGVESGFEVWANGKPPEAKTPP
jgi:hypothetical protein